MTTYQKLLDEPEWKTLTERHCKRTKFACEDCGIAHVKLSVHHRVYGRRLKPWDYPDDNFVVVCWPCHTRREEIVDMSRTIFQVMGPGEAHAFLSRLLRSKGPLNETTARMLQSMEGSNG